MKSDNVSFAYMNIIHQVLLVDNLSENWKDLHLIKRYLKFKENGSVRDKKLSRRPRNNNWETVDALLPSIHIVIVT